MLYASITAGGRVDDEFARRIGTSVKALARVGGRTLLDRAIDAARGAGAQGIAVVGGAEVKAACADRVDRVIDESEDGARNVNSALFAWENRRTLFLTSDLPFVTAADVAAFVARVPDDAIGMPLASEIAYERCFPGAPPHVADLLGERVANGSAFVIPAQQAQRIHAAAERFFNARKSLIRMALMLGPELLLRFAVRRLSIDHLERHAHRLLGVRALAIRDASPALCFDVDTLADFEYAAHHA